MRSPTASLSNNQIGGYFNSGTGAWVETPEGLAALAEALKVNATLKSLKCAASLTCPIWKVGVSSR